jgi:hypothetical protein
VLIPAAGSSVCGSRVPNWMLGTRLSHVNETIGCGTAFAKTGITLAIIVIIQVSTFLIDLSPSIDR